MKFYTLPPRSVEWPYLLVTVDDLKELDRRDFETAIVDAGIGELKEFPFRYSMKKIYQIVEKAREHEKDERITFVIPDYPAFVSDLVDKYNSKAGNGESIGPFDTVKATIDNILHFIQYPGRWMPVFQNRKGRISIAPYRRTAIDFTRFSVMGVGSLLSENRSSIIRGVIGAAKLLHGRIHAFGLKATVLRAAKLAGAESFDTMSWKFPRDRGGHSAKNTEEAEAYFNEFVRRIPKYLKWKR